MVKKINWVFLLYEVIMIGGVVVEFLVYISENLFEYLDVLVLWVVFLDILVLFVNNLEK